MQPRPHFAAFFEIYKKIIFSRANFAKFWQSFGKVLAKFWQNLQNLEKKDGFIEKPEEDETILREVVGDDANDKKRKQNLSE